MYENAIRRTLEDKRQSQRSSPGYNMAKNK